MYLDGRGVVLKISLKTSSSDVVNLVGGFFVFFPFSKEAIFGHVIRYGDQLCRLQLPRDVCFSA